MAGKVQVKMISAKKKPNVKAQAASQDATTRHFRNLRCTVESCDFICKVPDDLLGAGKLRCPRHGKILKTREERGETRGRYMTAA